MKWNDLTMSERSDLMKIFLQNGVKDLAQMKNIYDYGGNLKPDWDPEHVHYHDEKGNKIDITAVANDPNMAKYKAMADAHYKEMENNPDRFTLNPAYQKAYNTLRFAAGQHNRSPFVDYNNLPLGLNKGSGAKGTILYDNQGNNYIPSYMADEYTTVPNTPTYSVPYTDNRGNVTYYQAKMPQQYIEKPPLPINYTITPEMITAAKQRANKQYIKDNTRDFYEMNFFETPFAADRYHSEYIYEFNNINYPDRRIYDDTAYNNLISYGLPKSQIAENIYGDSGSLKNYQNNLNKVMDSLGLKYQWRNTTPGDWQRLRDNAYPIIQMSKEDLDKARKASIDKAKTFGYQPEEAVKSRTKYFDELEKHPVHYVPTQQEAEKNSIFKLIPGLDY